MRINIGVLNTYEFAVCKSGGEWFKIFFVFGTWIGQKNNFTPDVIPVFFHPCRICELTVRHLKNRCANFTIGI